MTETGGGTGRGRNPAPARRSAATKTTAAKTTATKTTATKTTAAKTTAAKADGAGTRTARSGAANGRRAASGSARGSARSTTARRATAPAGQPPKRQPVGRAACVGVNRTEVAALVDHLGVGPVSALSPLGPLARPGSGRPPAQVLTDAHVSDRDAFAWGLSAMARPDRILDTRAGLYNSAPTPCCLYGSRRVGPVLSGLRPGVHVDNELLSPFGPEDLAAWVTLQLQFSAGVSIGLPDRELDGRQLAFLLAVVDAYKTAFVASLSGRRAAPAPIRISLTDVMEADRTGRKEPDRRWLVRTVGELFANLIRPRGQKGAVLPLLDDATARSEIRRYAAGGYLELGGTGRGVPTFELGPSLGMMAGSLFSWLNVLLVHDVQVLSWKGGPRAQEELLLFIVTEPTVWTLVSAGLTGAGDTAADVRFGLSALTVPQAERFAARFMAPADGVSLPDAVYAPAPAPAVPSPAPSPTPQAAAATREPAPAPTPAPETPPWTPTHRVPDSGMPAWERPDPSLQPTAHLDPGLEVQVVEETTGWAHIVCSNTWDGWVDARYLDELAR